MTERDILLVSHNVVYVATNKVNGKCYIGATQKGVLARRWIHFWHARNGRPGKFYNAVRKHGEDAFEFRPLRACSDFFDALDHERRFIAKMRPEYNLTSGGGGVKGLKFSDESRRKMSEAKKGKPGLWARVSMPQHIRDKLAHLRRTENRVLSEQTKEKMRLNARKANAARRKRVVCLNDGIEYESTTAAAAAYGLHSGQITYYCQGAHKSRRGLAFKYVCDA